MKKFFGEFKTFITRGNVLDMSVGVIVGGAFTAIVNGLSNFILKPIINWLLALVFGADSLSNLFTYLKKVFVQVENEAGELVNTAEIDLTNSIYIDWGSFINAIINFLLTALVLFIIVRTMNKIKAKQAELAEDVMASKITKELKKEIKAQGISLKDKEAVKAYLVEKAAKQAEKEAEEARLAEEAAAKERAENPTTEDLLKAILKVLEAK